MFANLLKNALLALALIISFTGCTLDGEDEGGETGGAGGSNERCGSDDDCAPGFICSAGACVEPTPEIDGSVGGAGGSGGEGGAVGGAGGSAEPDASVGGNGGEGGMGGEADPCADITCPAGYECRAGECYQPDPCERINCQDGYRCVDGECEPVPVDCTPQCSNRQCGSDGCGGSCGNCGAGNSCENGECKPDRVPENTGVCSDGIDNDRDGAIDCDDDGCDEVCPAPERRCPDDFNCPQGQRCVEGRCLDNVPSDSDDDGVRDGDDFCFDIPEDRDGFQDDDGCPEPDCINDYLCDPWSFCDQEIGTCRDRGIECGPNAAPENETCRAGYRCVDERCVAVNLCDGVSCPFWATCVDGGCVVRDGCNQGTSIEYRLGDEADVELGRSTLIDAWGQPVEVTFDRSEDPVYQYPDGAARICAVYDAGATGLTVTPRPYEAWIDMSVDQKRAYCHDRWWGYNRCGEQVHARWVGDAGGDPLGGCEVAWDTVGIWRE